MVLEEYNYDLHYKPRKENLVADALSWIAVSNLHSITSTEYRSDSLKQLPIPSVETPINVFRPQIILKKEENTEYQLSQPYAKYFRHIFIEIFYTKKK